MLRRKKTKIAALLLSLAMAALMFADVQPQDVGIYAHTFTPYCSHWAYQPYLSHFTYSFFHANALHLILNIWCFLSCVFLADVSCDKLLAAYLIACTAPALSAVPTIGFSGVCFALLGFIMWQSRNKLSYNVWVISCIVLPLLLLPHSVNSLLHAYCYIVAVIVGLLSQLSQSSHNSHSPQ
jgi:membrane associated rhomboid family serine protease